MPPRPPPPTHTKTVFSPHSVHVLRPEKQAAVAGETSEIWCTLAECLGWDNIKVGGARAGETSEIWCTLAECLGWDNIKVEGGDGAGERSCIKGGGGNVAGRR